MTVFTNGCFDILHPGHYNLLMCCRELAGPGGRVIVAIDEDEKIIGDKKRWPIFTVVERGKAICDLRYNGGKLVDEVTFFHTNLELEMLVKKHKPDYLVKGSDWTGKVVGSDYAKVVYFGRVDDYSTTEIIHRCQKKVM